MSRTKEQFIEETGGFRPGESKAGFLARTGRIQELKQKLLSGVPEREREELLEEMQRLQGIPSPEWDYEPHD